MKHFIEWAARLGRPSFEEFEQDVNQPFITGEEIEFAKPVAAEPVAHTVNALAKARDKMISERDLIDADIRVMAERSRQLTVSCRAINKALRDLEDEPLVSANALEVAMAAGA